MKEETWYKQGDIVLEVSAEDNWYVLRCAAEEEGAYTEQDLSTYGDIELVFGSEDEIRLSADTSVENYSPVNGECVFFLSKKDAGRVRKSQERDWRLVAGGVSIYTGKWRKSEEAATENLSEIIASLNNNISEWEKKYNALSAEAISKYSDYEAQIASLRNSLTAAQQEAADYAEQLENLKNSMTEANVVETPSAETAVIKKLDSFNITALRATDTVDIAKGTFKVTEKSVEKAASSLSNYSFAVVKKQ